MDHSYEEIRGAALDVLAGREKGSLEPSQYSHLESGVAEVFARREAPGQQRRHDSPQLSAADADLFMEVFWDLFRQGIITLGCDRSNKAFPFLRVSHFGKRILENQDTYFFHDITSYTNLIQQSIPSIDPTTLLYLQEAMQAFRAGCMLSSSVMLGVAAEHTFVLLMETINGNPVHSQVFSAVNKERMILHKINKFREILGKRLGDLPPEIKEDLDTQFAGILAVIRNFRNESGHPTGKIIDREQMYVLLNLFVPYCRKMYQLMRHYSS